MSKSVVITGATGQLGQYFIQYLQDKYPDYKVIGTIRHKSTDEESFIFDKSKVIFELMDLADPFSIENIVIKYKPDYFINTAANAFVGESWAVPVQQIEFNTLGVLHQLEAIRKHSPHTRYYNSGTSEEFACTNISGPQNEDTKIDPKSPYGAAKAAARFITSVYQKSYNLYAIQGWTFNFESKLRSKKYVTGKIADGVARIQKAIKNNQPFDPIELGNIYSNRSWQHASDVVDGIWKMLNQDVKENKDAKCYVLSELNTHTVKEFIELAFKKAGIQGIWWNFTNRPEDELFILAENNGLATKKRVDLVKINPKFYRPLDVTFLYGDATKARNELGWEPKISFDKIVEEMVQYHINK